MWKPLARELEQVLPAIAAGPVEGAVSASSEAVRARVFRRTSESEGESAGAYLIALNTGRKPVRARLTLNQRGWRRAVPVGEGGEPFDIQQGGWVDALGPFEVHIYQLVR
ncbi:MAG TPA: hypothetical protein VF184_12155 [Phycisphaeraceae bacterium]